MKKRIVLLSIMLLLVSGCSIQQLSNTDFEENISMILSQDTNLSNVNFDGYEYYVPSGMRFVNKDDYNAVLQDRYSNRYYLYVDAIGYYHKTENTYKEDKDAFYSKKLKYNKKDGFIEINEEDNNYYIEMVFDYCKMEAYISKEYLVPVINNMSYILRSVQFHDKVLESLIGENVLDYKEEKFNIFESNADDSNDSVLEAFDDYVDADVSSGQATYEDNIEINEVD